MSEDRVVYPCERNPDLWFSRYIDDQRKAQRICGGCPFQDACAEAGATEEFGVWGGVLPKERELTVKAAKRQEFNHNKPVPATVAYQVWHWHLMGDHEHALSARFGLTKKQVKTIIANKGKVNAA